jgi:glutathione S-transferase
MEQQQRHHRRLRCLCSAVEVARKCTNLSVVAAAADSRDGAAPPSAPQPEPEPYPSPPAPSSSSVVRLYGATYSVYTRIARLVLAERVVGHELVEVDIFAKDPSTLPPDYLTRHPFGKIPALEHGSVRLIETDAIAQYICSADFDETTTTTSLLPTAPVERARCLQIMRVMDNYGFEKLVWGVYVEELERDRGGQLTPDEISEARGVLAVLETHLLTENGTENGAVYDDDEDDGEQQEGQFFLGRRQISLADLWVAPMIAYLRLAPTGRSILREFPKLERWWERVARRPSVLQTRFPLELELDEEHAG